MFAAIFGSMVVLGSFVGLLAAIRLLDAFLRYNGCDAIGGWLEAHGLGYKRRLQIFLLEHPESNFPYWMNSLRKLHFLLAK